MATKTPNYQLVKPEQTDFYDIDILNANMDIIDAAIAEKVGKQTGKGLSTNDYSNTDKAKVENLPGNTISELTNKVDKQTGKGLSTNDYSNADKSKVDNLPDNTASELSQKADGAALQTHTQNFSNPHNVNLKQAGGSNANLLDNWDFSNPVNQRGQTTYTAVTNSAAPYTIDRWLIAGDGTLTVNTGSLTLTRANDTSYVQLWQHIDNHSRLAGKKVTFSVSGNGKFSIILGVSTASGTNYIGSWKQSTGDELVSCTADLPTGLTSLSVVIDGHNATEVETPSYTVYSAKLETGGISTLENDAPMDYQSEYLKCLRYYYKGPISFIMTQHKTNSECYFCRFGYFPVPMRTAPTIIAIDQGNLSNEELQYKQTTRFCIAGIYIDEIYISDNGTLSLENVEVSADI